MAISHSWRGDLNVNLTSPSGTRVRLHEESDDDTEDVIGTYPVTLFPVDSLDSFLGEDAAGDWTLFIEDTAGGDVGVLTSWSMAFACQ